MSALFARIPAVLYAGESIESYIDFSGSRADGSRWNFAKRVKVDGRESVPSKFDTFIERPAKSVRTSLTVLRGGALLVSDGIYRGPHDPHAIASYAKPPCARGLVAGPPMVTQFGCCP